jgi:predicted permease
MQTTNDIINQVLPILLLISLGIWMRRKNFLAEKTVQELQKLVVNFALPAVLFLSFLTLALKPSYLLIFGVILALVFALFFLGQLIYKKFNIPHLYFPYLVTGFEYGMMGISLFGAAYGLEKIGYLAVMDLGQEVFIWFVFMPLLLIKRDGAQNPTAIVKSFLSSPVVLSIIFSLGLNFLSAGALLARLPVTGALLTTFDFLGKLTVPLILISVGYGIKIDRSKLGAALQVVFLRLGLLIPLALVLNATLIRGYLGLEPFFEKALFTLLILPPPFIVPLYIPETLAQDEKEYINNVLTIHSVISIGVFLLYFGVTSLS